MLNKEDNDLSLLKRIRNKIPIPIWLLVLLFGPILPVVVLVIYCIDWYCQVF